MSTWRQRGNLWYLSPHRPIGVIEFIGGGYFAAIPHLTYKLLLEELASAGFMIRAWSYIPTFDHQAQAKAATYSFHHERQRSDQHQVDQLSIRIGHSLGCKLHLLATDGGYNSKALVALSFNNYSAIQSIPLLSNLSKQLGLITDFSPCPSDTFRLISKDYKTSHNLLVQFSNDQLDQSYELLKILEKRPNDSSKILSQPGDHLTPIYLRLPNHFVNNWPAQDKIRCSPIDKLTQNILSWCEFSIGGKIQ
uniref:Alpha/beta hydrolase n=1 Tax=Paulinella micropora TaxID=1928728 RepID=A0A385HZS1_9EUKA|nr:hypothetical protein PMNZ_216 [Paulinella micropora]AXY63170.1 hypothetical protein PMNZ_216 [Paulinella micropora]